MGGTGCRGFGGLDHWCVPKSPSCVLGMGVVMSSFPRAESTAEDTNPDLEEEDTRPKFPTGSWTAHLGQEANAAGVGESYASSRGQAC